MKGMTINMNQFVALVKDKEFLRKTMAITIPIAVQNLLNTALNMIDTVMISQLGETAIAAVGLANKFFFVFVLLMFGICSGSSILAAQYWGKREPLNIKRVLYIALIIGVSGAMIFMLLALFAPELVMRVFTPEADTIADGVKYLLVIAFSYPLTAITMIFISILRSMNYVKLPIIITSISILVNATLNYGLIFGKLGMPELGITGAALATLIARIVECVSLVTLVYIHKAGDGALGDFIHSKPTQGSVKERFLNKGIIYKYATTAAPVMLNEFMWGLGVTMYSLVYGRMGNAAVAAITIESTIEQGLTVFFFGVSAAAAVILGNELGSGQLKKAEEDAKKFILLQLGLTIIAGILAMLIKGPVIAWFGQSEQVGSYVSKILNIFVILLPVKMVNHILITAVFRSGGDTKASLFIDVSGVWFIGIPMAVLGGLVLKQPVYVVFAMVAIEEVYKFIMSILRYRQKKWVRNIVGND